MQKDMQACLHVNMYVYMQTDMHECPCVLMYLCMHVCMKTDKQERLSVCISHV